MNRRRLALASIAVVAVLCLVGVALAAVAAGGSAVAFEVDGRRTSQRDFDRQLRDIVDTDAGASQSHSAGTILSTTAAQVLQANIILELLRAEADAKGVEVTASERSTARQQVDAQTQGLPASFRDLQTEILAHVSALGLTTDAKSSAFLSRAVRHAHIYVNPRYGRWSPKYGVCPPTGCVTANGTEPSSGSGG